MFAEASLMSSQEQMNFIFFFWACIIMALGQAGALERAM